MPQGDNSFCLKVAAKSNRDIASRDRPNLCSLLWSQNSNFGVAAILKLMATSTFQGTYAFSASKSLRHSGITLVYKTAFDVFTRVGPDNSLERLTKRRVGLVTDRPSNVDELSVTLL